MMNMAEFCAAACRITANIVTTAAQKSAGRRPIRSVIFPYQMPDMAPPTYIDAVINPVVVLFRLKYKVYCGSIFKPFLHGLIRRVSSPRSRSQVHHGAIISRCLLSLELTFKRDDLNLPLTLYTK
jgi:hypothetical protein